MFRPVVILPLLLAAASMARSVDDKDLIDRIVLDPTLKTFTKLVARAGMIEKLKSDGPFTILAPNDAAFAKLPVGTLDALLKDRAQVRKFVLLHVVSGKLMVKDLKEGALKMMSSDSITVKLNGTIKPKGVPTVSGAKILVPDVASSNGILHVIVAILVPAPPVIK
jgi:uncharacterized surface protein with fasciclin (FAS1) repeats